MAEQKHDDLNGFAEISGSFKVPGLKISRNVDIPDALRIARAKSLPGLGPQILFFSGGSALNGIARKLKSYTHNSMHLITPFDSGGSSQVLREAFDMPAVGDLRSRLMALADESDLGQPDIFALFTNRFSKTAKPDALAAEFDTLLDGSHPLMDAVSQPMRALILAHLKAFAAGKPDDFDLSGASVGNLILAGGYLTHDRALEPVLFIMSKMVDVQGTVRSVVDGNLGLGATLADGSTVMGQRALTGKEVPPITAAIERLFVTEDGKEVPGEIKLPKRNRKLIARADLICYSPGSLYTSVIANLLPRGVGRSVAARKVPKVYVPSLGHDPECPGLDLFDQVDAILKALRADAGDECPGEDLMNAIITDQDALDPRAAKKIQKVFGIPCLGLPLAKPDTPDRYDPEKICDALISLC